MLEEKKIGERFEYEGVTLEVVNELDFSCEKCFFYLGKCDNVCCFPHKRKDGESVCFRVVAKEHISTIQDCELAVEVTEKKAIEAAKEMIVDILNEVHGVNQTMYLEDFVARLKK
jgi:hypothetical protein